MLEFGQKLHIQSDIFRDFHAHLTQIEQAVGSFRSKPIKDWDRACWTGFFIELQARLGEGDWAYVPNPRGGFMGFTWHWRDDDTKYLQLEEQKMCFKIYVEDKTLHSSMRDEWLDVLLATAKTSELPVRRPDRWRSGTSMTVAIIDGEYRKTWEHDIIDLDSTLVVLQQAAERLDAAYAVITSNRAKPECRN